VLGDLAFFVLRLAHSTTPLRCRLVLIENHLLRERCLGWNKVDTLQLQMTRRHKGQPEKKASEKIDITKKANKMHGKDNNSQFFYPRVGEHQE
jgi:hypothetical protein